MRRPPITIRFALIALLLACVLPLATGIGVSAYLNSRETMGLLWRDLANELVEGAREKTLRHVEAGAGQLRLHRISTDSGELDPADHEQLLDTLQRCLLAHPSVTWCSYGAADGSYFSAYRTFDNEIRRTRRIRGEDDAEQTDWLLQPDGSLEAVLELRTDFDSRARPWWSVGCAATRPAWSRPFLFASHRQPGIVHTLRQDHPDGTLRGVWLLEYELSRIAGFLREMKEAARQRGGPFAEANVFIVSDNGTVIGHPSGETVLGSGDATRLIPAAEHPDDEIRQAYRSAGELGLDKRQRFRFDVEGVSFLGMSAPFEAGEGPAWTTLVTVPSEALVGPIRKSNRAAAIIATGITLVSVLVSLVLAERLARPLSRLAGDLERIGRLELQDASTDQHSRIREIAEMMAARDKMTGGLRSFSKYVPARLVRQLISEGQEATLGGEIRELTIFFSDIVGFTGMGESMPIPDLVDHLAGHFEQLSRVIGEESGVVDKFIGDSVMAFWGAPHRVENHALSACRAALRAQEQLAALRETQRQRGRPEVHARIGINSGEVLVGNIGAEDRMNYTVIGDAANVASRLEQRCKVHKVPILIGERTRELAGNGIVAFPIDKVVVKGREQGIVVHQLLALRQDASAKLSAMEVPVQTAFDAYLAGDFSTAGRILSGLLIDLPQEDPLRSLEARCRELERNPPVDWTGVIRSGFESA